MITLEQLEAHLLRYTKELQDIEDQISLCSNNRDGFSQRSVLKVQIFIRQDKIELLQELISQCQNK